MIIVSQGKMQILNFEQLQEIEINTPEDWSQGVYSIDTYPLGEGSHNHIRLGIYETEQRAKEVLQEIIDLYKINNSVYRISEECVYEMPKQ